MLVDNAQIRFFPFFLALRQNGLKVVSPIDPFLRASCAPFLDRMLSIERHTMFSLLWRASIAICVAGFTFGAPKRTWFTRKMLLILKNTLAFEFVERKATPPKKRARKKVHFLHSRRDSSSLSILQLLALLRREELYLYHLVKRNKKDKQGKDVRRTREE